jgi:hypothetical protein
VGYRDGARIIAHCDPLAIALTKAASSTIDAKRSRRDF